MIYNVDTVALKKLMIENGIDTYVELSEKSGVDRNTAAKVVKGEIRPSTAVIEKFIVALDMKPSVAGCIFFKPNLRNT